ncbi:Serpentine Receptor, class I [Caenorhabditis elegans]|uniref:Serpentine Receptor, class I n=1 Tax=Caenorhabditis elegans TaxID=6239 RepID=O16599_CAEEL|nr:Serpentine Receptor, class I [Caenorhabditis elegans]CCD68437.1 Serpentine Receptor, class I [Caenorhabditis elegans]|eukprot:NP_494310.1 Serpentine Receptor, class I [Caenorhabditis elegans]
MIAIDFTNPLWLTYFYHFIGVISAILNTLGIYLLAFKLGKLGPFRFYLLGFQISCMLTDIQLNLLSQPISLYPLLAGYTQGVMSTIFGISSHFCAMIIGFLALIQLEALTLCFGKKHQAIAYILKIHLVHDVLLYFCYFLCIFAPVVLCASMQYLSLSREEQLGYIRENFPYLYPDFLKLPHFVLYIRSPNLVWLFLSIFVGGLTISLIFSIFILDLFRLMRILRLKISRSTYQKHQEALRSLMVQLMTSILCIGPPCALVALVYLEIPNGRLLSEILIAMFASHSSINMLSLFIFFPPYRRLFGWSLKKSRTKRVSSMF